MTLDDVAIEYFRCFSRFEYALLKAQYFKEEGGCTNCKKKGVLVSDWDKFEVECLSELSLKKLKEISDDAAYLIAEPPKKRIIDASGNLDWRELPVTTTKEVIHACRRLRNNLFHGNKYAQDEPRDDKKSADQQRNLKLLKGALDILGEFLNRGADVRKFYDDASL